jgi:hypothetical protein
MYIIGILIAIDKGNAAQTQLILGKIGKGKK